jgi:Tol biopolymer transport system component
MKKTILFLLIGLMGLAAAAQQIEVKSIERVKGTETGGFYHPVFSPAGGWLLATSENYTGLQQISLQTNAITTLTQDPGAGYGVRISADESAILYKKTEFRENRRYTSLYHYSLADRKAAKLEDATREKLTPAFAASKPLYVKGETLVKKDVAPAGVAPFITIENQKMALYRGTEKTILTPNGADGSYFWASVSPDGKHIVYVAARGGAFVCRIDGSNPVSLGKLNAPVWLNNRWVVGMDDRDNGDVIIASEIVAATIDGKTRQTLATPQTKIAMYPAASADGKRIAFNSDKGEIYVLDITIN